MKGLRGDIRLAVVALAVVATACGTIADPSGPGGASPGGPGVAPTSEPADTPVTTPIPAPGHELYGFVPYWEMDDSIAAHVAATPLSTVALFSVTNTGKGALDTTQPGYKRITGSVGADLVRSAHHQGIRVELVFTSFGSARNATFFGRPALQDATIASLVALMAKLGADGVDVDVESLDLGLVEAYGSFVGRLRAALLAENAAATLSVATGPGPTGAAMAAAALGGGADRVFLMGYDYRTASSAPGAVAPITRADVGRSLTWSLDLYGAIGIDPRKLLLGLPLYGMAWPVAAPTLGAASTGEGTLWILRNHLDVLGNAQAVPVRDPLESVDVYILGSDGSVVAPPSDGPSASSSGGPSAAPGDSTATPGDALATGSDAPAGSPGDGAAASPSDAPSSQGGSVWTAAYVDSAATLEQKLGLAESRGLVGAGFWAIGYERGLPAYTDLMRRFVAGQVAAR